MPPLLLATYSYVYSLSTCGSLERLHAKALNRISYNFTKIDQMIYGSIVRFIEYGYYFNAMIIIHRYESYFASALNGYTVESDRLETCQSLVLGLHSLVSSASESQNS